MGSCVSMHKDPDAAAMKLRLSIGSQNENLLIPSPVKDKPVTVNAGDLTVADVALKPHWSPSSYTGAAGSKDEAFFDSQPWLESDCEDDYYSVNGDFTPSRGNTPVHHNFALGNLRINKSPSQQGTDTSIPEPSPPDRKKRLSELFKESLSGDHHVGEENGTGQVQESKSTNGTPYRSGLSSENTPNGALRDEKKSVKSVQCCIPRLLSTSHSVGEKKKKTSPGNSVG